MTGISGMLLVAGVCLLPADAAARPDSLAALWRGARRYAEFLAAARERRDQWLRVDSLAAVPDALAARARSAGHWKLLVLTVHECSDSINVLPYLARLAEVAPNLELRIADTTGGRWFMESRRTPDGRAATPTLVLLDDDFTQRGCWIERPAELQRCYLETGRQLSDDDLRRQKAAWYARDAGRQTLDEVIALVENAARRRSVCPER